MVAVIRYEDLNLSAEALEATRHCLVRTVPSDPVIPTGATMLDKRSSNAILRECFLPDRSGEG